MGKTTDSFKREIGKNVGKAVSTWIFKDAHATPYRRAGDIQRKISGAQTDTTEATIIAKTKCPETQNETSQNTEAQVFLLGFCIYV